MDSEEIHEVNIIEKENEELLLSLVKDRPCIYKKSSADHRDKIILENAWQEVAKIMHDSVENCKKSWENLKNQYRVEKKKQEEENRSGSAASKRKIMPHYETMKSLCSDEIPRRSHSNFPPTDAPSTSLLIDKKVPSSQFKRKKNASEQVIQETIQKLSNTVDIVSSKLQSKSSQDMNSTDRSGSELNDSNFLIGRLVVVELNKLNRSQAKKKRKKITKCLYSSSSDSE